MPALTNDRVKNIGIILIQGHVLPVPNQTEDRMGTASPKTMAAGPLDEFRVGFAEHITLLGYSERQSIVLKQLFCALNLWLAKKQLQVGDIRASEIKDFLAGRVEAGQTVSISMRAMNPLINYMREIGMAFLEPDCSVPGPLTHITER
jgi:hypothetical protein